MFRGFPQFDVADWEATIAHGLLHRDVEQWLAADSARARFYEEISRKTRLWSEDSRGEYWYAADALAMAFALHPEGAQRLEQRPVHIELSGAHTRGMTLVDWNRQGGAPDNANLLLAYDIQQFYRLVGAALAAN
ncbi:Inosine-uridine preferring nucleoside hydrolase family protein (fragment) [Xanthomonas citri pv. bilvae]